MKNEWVAIKGYEAFMLRTDTETLMVCKGKEFLRLTAATGVHIFVGLCYPESWFSSEIPGEPFDDLAVAKNRTVEAYEDGSRMIKPEEIEGGGHALKYAPDVTVRLKQAPVEDDDT